MEVGGLYEAKKEISAFQIHLPTSEPGNPDIHIHPTFPQCPKTTGNALTLPD
jgi:hypothetical protein